MLKYIWAVLSDEQMRKIWPFCLLNDEQMSNKVGVKHQPDIIEFFVHHSTVLTPPLESMGLLCLPIHGSWLLFMVGL